MKLKKEIYYFGLSILFLGFVSCKKDFVVNEKKQEPFTLPDYRIKLLELNSNNQATEVNSLFTQYGY